MHAKPTSFRHAVRTTSEGKSRRRSAAKTENKGRGDTVLAVSLSAHRQNTLKDERCCRTCEVITTTSAKNRTTQLAYLAKTRQSNNAESRSSISNRLVINAWPRPSDQPNQRRQGTVTHGAAGSVIKETRYELMRGCFTSADLPPKRVGEIYGRPDRQPAASRNLKTFLSAWTWHERHFHSEALRHRTKSSLV